MYFFRKFLLTRFKSYFFFEIINPLDMGSALFALLKLSDKAISLYSFGPFFPLLWWIIVCYYDIVELFLLHIVVLCVL